MANFCGCTGTLLNTGTPNKQNIIKAATKLFLVPLQDSNGNRNQILSTDTLDQSFFDGKIQNTDDTQRWYPVGNFINVTDERVDPNSESFSDGSRAITTQGLRTYTGWLLRYAAAYIEKLNSHACGKFGVYSIDDCGDLVGSFCADGGGAGVDALRPIQVNEFYFDNRLIKQQDTAAGKVQVQFDFAQTERDENLRTIKDADISGVNLLDYEGLLDLTVVASATSTTGYTLALSLEYQGFNKPVTITGLPTSAFQAFNQTTNSSITLTSVTEAPQGTYAVVIPAQSASDVIQYTVVTSEYFGQGTYTA